jgi:hypothetical protein
LGGIPLWVRLTAKLPVRTFVAARYRGGGFPPPLVRHRGAGLVDPLAAQARRTDVDPEAAFDLVFGPLLYRLLIGHAPLDEAVCQPLSRRR